MAELSKPDFSEARIRHARYYLQLLRRLDRSYTTGGPEALRSVARLSTEWPQIQAAQAWTRENHPTFCAGFALQGGGLLMNVLGNTVRLRWFEEAVTAFPQIPIRDPNLEYERLVKSARENTPPGNFFFVSGIFKQT